MPLAEAIRTSFQPVLPTSQTNSLATSLPQKLIKKIQNLEFVDMAELIPDAWVYQDEEPSKCCHHSRHPHKKGKVTDIVLWVECFAIFTGVLTSKYPQSAPDLMAYQRTIVHASRTYKGDCWLSYDTNYRRRAAACKSLHWAQIDFTLYNETFAGMARPIPRCTNCASEYHKSHECPVAAISTPTTESTFYAKPLSTLSEAGMGNNRRELCGLYNSRAGNRCHYKPCKHLHICAICHDYMVTQHPPANTVVHTPSGPGWIQRLLGKTKHLLLFGTTLNHHNCL